MSKESIAKNIMIFSKDPEYERLTQIFLDAAETYRMARDAYEKAEQELVAREQYLTSQPRSNE